MNGIIVFATSLYGKADGSLEVLILFLHLGWLNSTLVATHCAKICLFMASGHIRRYSITFVDGVSDQLPQKPHGA